MTEKKVFSTRVDANRIKYLKHLSVDTDKSIGDLLAEAIEDLLEKYKKKRQNDSPVRTTYRCVVSLVML